MKFGFVAKHRGIWPVRWLCEALGVSAVASTPGSPGRLVPADAARKASAHRSRPASLIATGRMVPGGSGVMCWPTALPVDCIASNG